MNKITNKQYIESFETIMKKHNDILILNKGSGIYETKSALGTVFNTKISDVILSINLTMSGTEMDIELNNLVLMVEFAEYYGYNRILLDVNIHNLDNFIEKIKWMFDDTVWQLPNPSLQTIREEKLESKIEILKHQLYCDHGTGILHENSQICEKCGVKINKHREAIR